ncbi:MAG: GNAT family N-acetyltransferase [Pseudomonadota bacterium]
MIHVRKAGTGDTGQLADLLNAIIAKGGTTAHTQPLTGADLSAEIRLYPGQSAWFLAEDDGGQVLGFQNIQPNAKFPADAADIATFVRLGQTGRGVGSKLFEATKTAARDLGYTWISATIRADNDSGLTYYQSRGFEDYERLRDTRMSDGTVVDRICKRYDLAG